MFKTYRKWFAVSVVCHMCLLGWMSMVKLPAQQQKRPLTIHFATTAVHPDPVRQIHKPKPRKIDQFKQEPRKIDQPKPDPRKIDQPQPDPFKRDQPKQDAPSLHLPIEVPQQQPAQPPNVTKIPSGKVSGPTIKSPVKGDNDKGPTPGGHSEKAPVLSVPTPGPSIPAQSKHIMAVLSNLNPKTDNNYAGEPHPTLSGVLPAPRNGDPNKVLVETINPDGTSVKSVTNTMKPTLKSNPVPGVLYDTDSYIDSPPKYMRIESTEAKFLASPNPRPFSKLACEGHFSGRLVMTVTISKGGMSTIVTEGFDALNGYAPNVKNDVSQTAEAAVHEARFSPKTIHGDPDDGGTVTVAVEFTNGYAKVYRN